MVSLDSDAVKRIVRDDGRGAPMYLPQTRTERSVNVTASDASAAPLGMGPERRDDRAKPDPSHPTDRTAAARLGREDGGATR
jgi:hypothetical protein